MLISMLSSERRGGGFSQSGFTIVELMTVIVILAIMVSLAVPVFLDVRANAQRNTCRYDQRAIESALMIWRSEHPDEEFVTENCLPGGGEAFIDIEGNVPGDPSRSLARFQKRGFDCPSNGYGVGQVGNCDYVTDGTSVTCLTDNQVGLKADGEPFAHDLPLAVEWDHVRGIADEDNVLRAIFRKGQPSGWDEVMGSTWMTLDGIYAFGSTGYMSEHRSFWGDPDWKDGTVSLKGKLKSGYGYGVYFRATGGQDVSGYCFQYDQRYGGFIVRPVVNGRELSPIARYTPPEGYDWYNTERAIEIDSRGNSHTIKVDGKEVLNFSDDRFKNGQIGLRGWIQGEAEFRDIEVRPR